MWGPNARATPCTLVISSNIDSTGVARYPLGNLPVMDPATGATLIDALGRRSCTTSIALGPTIGKNIALAYLPHAYCQVRLSPSGLAASASQRTMPGFPFPGSEFCHV